MPDAGHAQPFYLVRGRCDKGTTYRAVALLAPGSGPDLERAPSGAVRSLSNVLARHGEASLDLRNVAAPVVEPLFGESGHAPTTEDLARLSVLASTMYGHGNPGRIPAGYTYAGQFISHDMCRSVPIDGTPRSVTTNSFALDLDSVYGGSAGCDGARLSIGETAGRPGPYDIHREPSGEPLIGNRRNDSNLALSQFHCALVRYHNAVADSGHFTDFETVRRQVTLSFQAAVLHDLLPRLIGRDLVTSILAGNRSLDFSSDPVCPAEAALAALRTGHSMVRRRYPAWNGAFHSANVENLLQLNFSGGGLVDGKLHRNWTIDWRNFFELDAQVAPIPAMAIDTAVAPPMEVLPSRLFQIEAATRSLAFRTLWFGAAVQILDGWAIQRRMINNLGLTGNKADSAFPMRPDLLPPDNPAAAALLQPDQPLGERPPLWWFVLREAQLFGCDGGLAGVGARLFGETVITAIEAAEHSVLTGTEPIHPALPGGNQRATLPALLSAFGQPVDWYRAP